MIINLLIFTQTLTILTDDPRPQTVEEWNILYNRQMEFLNQRNSRIDKSFNG